MDNAKLGSWNTISTTRQCQGIDHHGQTGKQHLDRKTLDLYVPRQGVDYKGRERFTEGAEAQHFTGKRVLTEPGEKP